MTTKGKNHWKWNNGKTIQKGYPKTYLPDHARAESRGYVNDSLLICEKVMQDSLPPKAIIHHVDGNPLNNENFNLVICQDQAYHMLLHKRTKALLSCNHADFEWCNSCMKWLPPYNFYRLNGKVKRKSSYCRKCQKAKSREYWRKTHAKT